MKKVTQVKVENDITGEETYYWNTKIALAQADLEANQVKVENDFNVEVGENPFEGMNFQEGLFPTAREIDYHDAVSIGEQHRDQEWILSDRDVFHKNPFYTGPRTPHPEELDDDGVPYFGLGYYEVENQHSDLKWLADRCQVAVPHNSIIEDDDIPF